MSFYIGASGKDIMHVNDLLVLLVKLQVISPEQHGWFFNRKRNIKIT